MTLPPLLAARLRGGDERFAVTGASGWLGRVTLDVLRGALGSGDFERKVTAFASAPKRVELRDGTVVAARPLDELATTMPASHVLHFAYPTRDKVATLGLDAFVRTTAEIAVSVLGALEGGDIRGLFFASSGAVYDRAGGLAANPYGACKRLDELALRRACADAGVTSIVARVFSVSGPYMTKRHLYALGDLIDQATSGAPIYVRAQGPVRRSYVAATDLVAVALAELVEPSSPDLIFDTGGDEIVEVGELAVRVRDVVGDAGSPIRRELDPARPPDDYVGDGAAIRALAARQGITLMSLDDQIRRTAVAKVAAPTC